MIPTPQNFWFTKPFPVRAVGSGTRTLAATTAESYGGTNSRQTRWQMIVSNLHATNRLKLRTGSGVVLMTIFPSVSQTIFCSDDLQIYNPNGDAVDYEVVELFYDEGTATPAAQPQPGQAAGAGGAGGTGGGGTYGGGGSGYSGSSPGGGYSRPGITTKVQ